MEGYCLEKVIKVSTLLFGRVGVRIFGVGSLFFYWCNLVKKRNENYEILRSLIF